MKLTTEQHDVLVKKKRDGTAYSDLLIYGTLDLGTTKYRPTVSKTARVELSRASNTPAALAKILERYAKKPSVPGALLEIICVVIAQGFTELADARAPAKHVDGTIACAAALQQLLGGRRSLPMFGEDAIRGLVAFWLASKTKPARLTAILERLIPAEVTDEALVEFRKAIASKSAKRSR